MLYYSLIRLRNWRNAAIARVRSLGRRPFGVGRDAKVARDVLGAAMAAYCLNISEKDLARIIYGRRHPEPPLSKRLCYLHMTVVRLSENLTPAGIQEVMRTWRPELDDTPMECFRLGKGDLIARRASEERLTLAA